MTRFAAPALVAVLAAAGSAVDPARPPAPTVQDVVFFSPDGPVRVRLTLTRHGRPLEDGWTRALDGLFAFADKNGDGTLDATERAAVQQSGRGLGEGYLLLGNGVFRSNRATGFAFPETNGKVGREEFRSGFRSAGYGPVAFTPVPPRADSKALTDALFKHLDANGDGTLSATELRAARTRLAHLDVNEDELLTPDELLKRTRGEYLTGEVVILSGSSYATVPQPPRLAEVVMPGGRTVTAEELLAARDTDKDGVLTAAELGCPPAAFARLDANGDGKLDADELASWLRSPADLEATVDLTEPAPTFWGFSPDRARGSPPVAIGGTGRMTDRAKAEGDGAVRLSTPAARIRITADPRAASGGDQWRHSVNSLRLAFDELAGEAGVLEKKRLAERKEFRHVVPLFELADRDGDGKMSRAELDALHTAYDPLSACRAEVVVADRGRGLFELLDRDGDGVLTPRELNAAADLLAALDRNGDGKLSRDELPCGYEVTVRPAAISVFPQSVWTVDDLDLVDFTFFYDAPVRPAVVLPADVPEWFRAMDRNGDGDVSAREFVGPPALFKRIDTDGDGLISPAEARAYEKARRGR
jgi:Ca2+-binding EF-hand superfamily protein